MSESVAAEKVSRSEMIALLRTVADAMESGESCVVQVGHQEIVVPGRADVEVEYERDGDSEQLEIELSWSSAKRKDGRNLKAKAGIGLALTAGAVAGGAALLQYLQHQKATPESTDPDLALQQADPLE